MEVDDDSSHEIWSTIVVGVFLKEQTLKIEMVTNTNSISNTQLSFSIFTELVQPTISDPQLNLQPDRFECLVIHSQALIW